MSNALAQVQQDFTGSANPGILPDNERLDPKKEVELKFTTAEATDLHRILDHLVKTGQTSSLFYNLNPECFYKRDPEQHPHILLTRPVSWYLDDKERSLSKAGSDLRCRFTPYIPDFVQWGVKGLSSRINGIGGVARHEDEIETHGMTNLPVFTDPRTLNVLAPVKNHPLHFWVATAVDRRMAGVPVQINNGKTALFEVSTDFIRFITARKGTEITGHADFNGPEFITLGQHNQLEIEYFNPLAGSQEMQRFARELDLAELSTPEVAEALHQLTERVQETAAVLGITGFGKDIVVEKDPETTAHKDESRSKSGIAFEEFDASPDAPAPDELVPAPFAL